MDATKIFIEIGNLRHEMEEALMSLVSIPAIGPENAGEGEELKAQKLIQILKKNGFKEIERYDSIDNRVHSGKRPNIIARFNGKSEDRNLWIITHLDVVPAGKESAWTVTKPFKPIQVGDRIYGRGTEDNGQSLVASIFAIKALMNLGLKPKFNVGLVFVADEEAGSKFGIEFLIDKGIFKPNDLVVVPDSGNAEGSFIEVAEKSILWFKLQTIGKQSHGSRPNNGLNAHRIGMEVSLAIDKLLHEKYNFKDPQFDVPESTFEPTKKEANVDAVNVIPGEDTVYFDCRIHPSYNLEEVLGDINGLLSYYEEKTGAKFKFEIIQKQSAPNLDIANSEIVLLLKSAIKQVRGITPIVGGVGGGSCAAFFRKMDIPAAVWSTIDEMAHQPNEYSNITNMIADAKVFAVLAMS